MKIVAPAGNMERFYSAVNAGADEIYMGLKALVQEEMQKTLLLKSLSRLLIMLTKEEQGYFLH